MATPANSTPYAVYGQIYNLTGAIVSSSTGNPITGGLTSLSATISKDDGSFTSTTNTPTEIGTSGYFTLDLTAAEMTASKIIVQISASNTNAVYQKVMINPMVMSEPAGRWDAQGIKRVEQLFSQVYAFFFNRQVDNGASQTVYKSDSATTMVSGVISENTDYAERGKLS